MVSAVEEVRQGLEGSYLLPFFWQHGAEESVLRTLMEKIQEANIHEICVESRPHPDFCGPGWWRDLDIIRIRGRAYRPKVSAAQEARSGLCGN